MVEVSTRLLERQQRKRLVHARMHTRYSHDMASAAIAAKAHEDMHAQARQGVGKARTDKQAD